MIEQFKWIEKFIDPEVTIEGTLFPNFSMNFNVVLKIFSYKISNWEMTFKEQSFEAEQKLFPEFRKKLDLDGKMGLILGQKNTFKLSFSSCGENVSNNFLGNLKGHFDDYVDEIKKEQQRLEEAYNEMNKSRGFWSCVWNGVKCCVQAVKFVISIVSGALTLLGKLIKSVFDFVIFFVIFFN